MTDRIVGDDKEAWKNHAKQLAARLAACEQRERQRMRDLALMRESAERLAARLAACEQERDTERSIRKETFARLARAEEAQAEADRLAADLYMANNRLALCEQDNKRLHRWHANALTSLARAEELLRQFEANDHGHNSEPLAAAISRDYFAGKDK